MRSASIGQASSEGVLHSRETLYNSPESRYGATICPQSRTVQLVQRPLQTFLNTFNSDFVGKIPTELMDDSVSQAGRLSDFRSLFLSTQCWQDHKRAVRVRAFEQTFP
jgi:hypothetical protein